jgi:hypothetical protein
MERLVNDFKFRGFKFEMSRGFGFMGYHPDFRLDGSLMAPVWELAQGRALAVSLDLGTFGEPSMQVEAVATLAARYPGIRFVLEHIFFPGPANFEDVEKALALLAPCQNVSVTVASVPASLPEKFPFPSTCRYIRIAKSTLGSERILWGSDLPSVAVNNTYRQLIDYVKESDVFDARELEGFYSGNAARVYRL